MEDSWLNRLPAAHRPAVPLAQPGLRHASTTSSPPSTRATASRSSASGARRLAVEGITVHALTGQDITEDAWDAFFDFYMETGSRKWGRPYLTREFYSLIGESMADDMLLVMAKRDGRWIAGAINFIGVRHAVRPPLGRDRASSVPAFRGLLLSGDRLRHRARPENASRPARRASTSSRAAICRRPPIPRTTSPTPASRRAVDDYLKRERAYVAEAARELTEAAPFRKAPKSRLDG